MAEVETTIGFDLRLMTVEPEWMADRRALYLLRSDGEAVRSVDTLVWARPPGLSPPAGEQLWPDLASLLEAARDTDRAGTVAIRITAFEEEQEEEERTLDSAQAGQLLGYDVADYWLLSGLTNCGYKPEEAAALTPAWAPRLNQWHLFADPDDAEAFAEITSSRVHEHAPFYQYGIYQLG